MFENQRTSTISTETDGVEEADSQHHTVEMCDTSNQCTYLCAHTPTHENTENVIKEEKEEKEERGWADGSCGEKFKHSTMSLEKGLKEYFPTFQ